MTGGGRELRYAAVEPEAIRAIIRHRLRQRLSPMHLQRIQRGLALATALVLAWRLHDTIPQARTETVADKELPACCH